MWIWCHVSCEGSSCTFSHEKNKAEETIESQKAGDADVDSDPESVPEAVPAAGSVGAKSILKAKVTQVNEEKSLVHLLTDSGHSRVVYLKSFLELWPLAPRSGDRISFPPPPGGPTSRWILPTLESIAPSGWSDLALTFLKSMCLGYEEQGSSILMRRPCTCGRSQKRLALKHLETIMSYSIYNIDYST